jgi:hypothetical protein
MSQYRYRIDGYSDSARMILFILNVASHLDYEQLCSSSTYSQKLYNGFCNLG